MRPSTLVRGMRRSCSGRRRSRRSRGSPRHRWCGCPRRPAPRSRRGSPSRPPRGLRRGAGRRSPDANGPEPHGDLGRDRRRVVLHVGGAGHPRRWSRPCAGPRRSRLSRSSPKSFTTTCAVEPVSVSSIRSARKPRMAKLTPGMPSSSAAQVVLHRLGVLPGERHQVHLELGVVRAPGVLGELSAPGALGHRVGRADRLEQPGGDDLSQAHRFLERRAGDGRHVNEVVPLAELGQEGGAEERQRGDGADAEHHRRGEDRRPAPGRASREQPRVAALEVAQHRATRGRRRSAGRAADGRAPASP